MKKVVCGLMMIDEKNELANYSSTKKIYHIYINLIIIIIIP